MIGALVAAISHRWWKRLLTVAVLAFLVIWSAVSWPIEWWAALWSGVCVVAVVLACLHDTGDGAE